MIRAVACGLLTCFAACSGGSAPERGFGSRQLLATRDPSFAVIGQGYGELLASTSVDGGSQYTSINLTTGRVENLGPDDSFSQGDEDAGADRFTCATASSASGGNVVTVTDTQSGHTTAIDGVLLGAACPTDPNQRLVIERTDSTGVITFWAGTYDRLAQVGSDLDIRGDVTFDGATITVLAARTSVPGALGIYAIDPITTTTREIVPPVLAAAAYADGAPPAGPLVSDTLSQAFGVWSFGDHFLYARLLADGEDVIFVGPFATGPAPELAVAPLQLPTDLAEPSRSLLGYGGGPAFIDGNATGSVLRYWDDAGRRLVSCDLPSTTASLSWNATSNGRQLLFGVDRDRSGDGATGPLLLMSLDLAAQGRGCSLLATQDVASSGFSRGGTSMFWVSAPDVGDATLWTAAADGTASRMLGEGIWIHDVHFLDDARLELTLFHDLVWLDATEPAPRLHYVAENVFGDSLDFFGNTIVTGYELNPQDDTGLLGVVDRDTGAKRLISPSVVSYRGIALPSVDGGVNPAIGIVYIVRGRSPSAQDGLWLAAIDVGDLR